MEQFLEVNREQQSIANTDYAAQKEVWLLATKNVKCALTRSRTPTGIAFPPRTKTIEYSYAIVVLVAFLKSFSLNGSMCYRKVIVCLTKQQMQRLKRREHGFLIEEGD